MLSRQSKVSLAQVLHSLPRDSAAALMFKHAELDLSHFDAGLMGLTESILRAESDAAAALLKELIANRASIRADAPPKYVFDERFENLEQWLLYDGWRIEDRRLLRVGPAVEDATALRDDLAEVLSRTGIDKDGAIRKLAEGAADDFRANPPDFNGSISKVRTALETIVRRISYELTDSSVPVKRESWGSALQQLQTAGFIDRQTETTLSAIYTFISPGAHVPIGLDDEEWARLARTYAVSASYFLAKRFEGMRLQQVS